MSDPNITEIEVRADESGAAKPVRNHALTAALIGGAAAATAGAVWTARALARRNGAEDGKPVNAILGTACTASEVGRKRQAGDPEIQPSAHPKLR